MKKIAIILCIGACLLLSACDSKKEKDDKETTETVIPTTESVAEPVDVTEEFNIYRLAYLPDVKLKKGDDLSDVSHIILLNDDASGLFNDSFRNRGCETFTSENMVIDVSNKKYYYEYGWSGTDYRNMEIVRNLSDEEIKDILSEYRGLINSNYKKPQSYCYMYHFDISLVKYDGTVIRYEGYLPDDEKYPGLEAWIRRLFEYSR